jgi:HK97 family phage portal protein
MNYNDNDEEVKRVLEEELLKFPTNVTDLKVVPSISTLQETKVSTAIGAKDIYDRNYSSKTGVPLSHPLELMTLIMNENSWVDLGIKTIASSCASSSPLFRIFSKANGRNKLKASNSRKEALENILAFPNPHQTGYEMFLTIFENLAGYGNAYVQIIRTKGGEIHSLYTLPPETIRIIPYIDKYGILHCAYYQKNVLRPKDIDIYLESEIIHFKDTNTKSFLYGMPRIYPLIGHITANTHSMQAINSWFEEGFAGGAIFKMDADELVAQRNREFLRDHYAGAMNYGKILLLEGSTELVSDGNKYIGNIKFDEMAAIGRDTILSCMGVPLSMAGVRSDAGMGNAEIVASEEKAFKRNTVDRYHKIVFGKLQQKLIREFLEDKDLMIEPGTLSKFALKDSIEAVRALGEIGVSIGEAREMLGMRSLEIEEVNKTMVIRTNNGLVRFEDVIGLDPETGEEVMTLVDKSMQLKIDSAGEASGKNNSQLDKKVNELTSGSSGLGGELKDIVEGP